MESFKLFRFLPPEIRRMIWKECLPSRVVEIHESLPFYGASKFQLAWCTWRNSLPPVITSVCRESRSIALETGGPLNQSADPPTWLTKDINSRAWFDPKRDILASYLHHSDGWFDRDKPAPDYSGAYFDWFARQNQDGLILADHFFHWPPNQDEYIQEFDPNEETMQGISKRKDYFVAIHTSAIYAKLKDALDSGLFGLLGDAPIQIVDPYDTERMQMFLDLSEEQDTCKEELVQTVTDTKWLKESVDQWSLKLMSAWIWRLWIKEKETSFLNIPYPENVWIGSRWVEYDGALGHIEEGERPNMDHPWVISIMDDMPHFRPVFLFTLGNLAEGPTTIPILNCIPDGRYSEAERRGSSKGIYEIAKQHRDKAAWEGNELDLAHWKRFLTHLSQGMVDPSFAEARQH